MIGVLILGILLRVISLNQSFWLDEAISTLAATKFSYIELITTFPKYDFHPPLFYIILKFWGGIFGYSEVPARTLPLIFGIATVVVVYKLSKELKIKTFWATLLMATAPLHVYYSQEVRMYPLVAFFVTLSFLFFLKLVKKEKPVYLVLFSLSVILFMALDYVAVFMLPVFLIIPILARKKKDFYAKLFLAFIPLIILVVLWLPMFTLQLSSGRELAQNLPLWANVVGSPSIKELALVWVKFIIGRITFFNKFIYGFLVLGFSLVVGYHFLNGLKSHVRTLAVWILAPLTLGFVFSFFIPAFSYFRFLYLLPAFVLLIAAGIKSNKGLAAILVINIFCLGVYYTNKNNWREEWREAVSFVEKNAKSDEIVVFELREPVAGWEWYASGEVKALGVLDKEESDTISGKKGVWYFEYLADITDPDKKVLRELKDMGFITVGEFPFRGVGKVMYLRRI